VVGPPLGAGSRDEDTADDIPVVPPMPLGVAVTYAGDEGWAAPAPVGDPSAFVVAGVPAGEATATALPPDQPDAEADLDPLADRDPVELSRQLLRPFALVGAVIAVLLLVTTLVLLTRGEPGELATDQVSTDQTTQA